ncbi:sacsin N-terminal ATP-binding-like domain-containing protein [Mongoliitalea daihaiensis]|uniref:sacsin N-terminal ATP-binding-like domain-containing protein n=1 Tax=Mongoliitalea daihaiensis TaxID=2782006 RepID=UPI001F2E3A3D|nr:DUF3883 domain-containing protein [Mongoliitalea daihaiensis]UJP64805.1 DUF3883 domain-containing protein [Mongoliitalea daihaiensis]
MEKSLTEISANSIFEKHYECYKKVWIETIKQQAGQVEQVSSDYQGRVIYELLQNAFDKAEKRILVKVNGNVLYIANDGTKFTYTTDYDYEKNSTERGDFQSLCSISTSTKNAANSIGNKGVGFKSAFSIAEHGFVNIHTQGNIIKKGVTNIEENISFRIYDSFKTINSIPKEFDLEIQENLSEKISIVQKEFKGRGVPGFYFPLQIKNEDETIKALFNDGFVTVIEIPFDIEIEQIVQSLYDEIEKIHFQFIRLKYDKDFKITFDYNGKIHKQKIEKNIVGLYSIELQNEELKQLARKINIEIEKPVIAFYINYETDGVLFNYLPSKVSSPFKNIDFHADFQTKVDRTNINFDKNSDVGKYNRALLQACVEFFFATLNNHLDSSERVELNLKWVDKNLIDEMNLKFEWRLLEIKNHSEIFHEVRSLLKIWDWEYNLASDLITRLTRKYFQAEKSNEEYAVYYDTISDFLERFTSKTNQYYIWVERFKNILAPKLLSLDCNLLPEISLTRSKEIFYKKRGENSLHLPSFIGVSITDFEIKDKYLRKKLGVKDFEDYNEILKYFKQVSYTGTFEKDSLTEKEQIELLKSIVQIMKNKKEVFTTCSHRYTRTFTSEERKIHSVVNQAYFNVSTVFLKTSIGKYKPAQLCRKSELDTAFLDKLDLTESLDSFLRFIGVSLDNNFIFCDLRIYNNLNNGIDYIPALFKRNETVDKLYGDDLLKNVRVISAKNKKVHPALINDNNYSFLQNISGRNIKSDLDNLRVKDYDNFPKEYLYILFEKLYSIRYGIERLYSSLFSPLHKHLNKYLISTKGTLEWKSKDDDFFIAQNKQDYEILKKYEVPLLNFYNGNEIPEELLNRKIILTENDIIANPVRDITTETLSLVESRICYMLSTVSNSNLSDLNYKDNSSGISVIQQLLFGCQVFECTSLSREIISNKSELKFENRADALFDKESKKIYFIQGCSKKTKAEFFAKYLFNNTSISSALELILFFKEPEDLEIEYETEDLNLFKKLWDKDYDKKFIAFEKEILDGFLAELDNIPQNWHIYNRREKSSLLLKFFNQGKLLELEKKIISIKQNYNNLFDDFQLEIDYSLNDNVISNMISFLEFRTDEVSKKYINELNALSKSFGQENRLEAIEKELIEKFNFSVSENVSMNSLDATKSKLNLDRKVDSIFNKLPVSNSSTTVTNFSANGKSEANSLVINKKKLVFQGGSNSTKCDNFLEETGANGEEQVLGYYINLFMTLSHDERKSAIEKIYQVIKEKLGNDSHNKFREKCLIHVKNDVELKKALIPYFYIAMHHKFAYLDIIAYENNSPIIIEVKTTSNNHNDSFYISIAEVNEALKESHYQIVRVTPSEIIFMGNPIKDLGNKLTSINGDNYKLIPRNYKFEFSKKNANAK